LEGLLVDIARRLDDGVPAWPAVSDALSELIERQYRRPGLARRRLDLWQREPALRETAIAGVVVSHIGSASDNLAFARGRHRRHRQLPRGDYRSTRAGRLRRLPRSGRGRRRSARPRAEPEARAPSALTGLHYRFGRYSAP
jgi:hypothetical protein